TPLIISVMVIISAIMRFVQEAKSDSAAEALADSIQNTANVERIGAGRREMPIDEIVVGDIVHLAAGDIIPADVRLVSTKDFFVSQSSITGESLPIEKTAAAVEGASTVFDIDNICLMGSTVISGSGVAVVVGVGNSTTYGGIARTLAAREEKTAFELGIDSVSLLFVRLMLVMAPIVFAVNGLTKGDWLEALLFALSVAVGLTPEMLPMIITTCMAKGATDLSHEKVIVKRLDAVQDLGSIDILCSDKTGTLTEDRVVLERYLDIHGNEDLRVLGYAFLNSFFETGLRNLIDSAIINRASRAGDLGDEEDARTADELAEDYFLVDEIPFDYERRRVSVVVGNVDGHTSMITKGAIEEILAICGRVEYDGGLRELTDEMEAIVLARAAEMADQGMRVLGVARKESPAGVASLTAEDETDMILIGYLAFLDPPKKSAADAIRILAEHGVDVKVLTGDSTRVARYLCTSIGIDVKGILEGTDVERMDSFELERAVEETTIFSKVSPDQKARLVNALKKNGHVVGYMGDGVNDALALRASDCGISVDTATDVAKESADIIMLEKDLLVLERGIVSGRHAFQTMLSYIRMAVCANFGNIFTVLVASAFLPFLPMTAPQLLLLNLIFDISCISLPWDDVDPELTLLPHTWSTRNLLNLMLHLGPVSSLIDIATFAVLLFVVCPAVSGGSWAELAGNPEAQAVFAGTFQGGWFIESMITQVLSVHIVRTAKMPFLESRASLFVTLMGLGAAILSIIVPNSPIGAGLAFAGTPSTFRPGLVGRRAADVVHALPARAHDPATT
ncbi:MAG: magnesium-translocating P-type ATPase, partial [Atopobiaceae bacterium]|nr:magnesium-translocating P-type ATPase [Atopobiaceae bacterium]